MAAGGSSIRSWIGSCEEAVARVRCTGCTPPPSPRVQRQPREELELPWWPTAPSSTGGAWAARKAGSVRLSHCRPSTLERNSHSALVAKGKLRRNLHSLGSVSRQSCCSSSSRSPARGRGDPGHGPSPFRSMSIRNSTRKWQTLGLTGHVSDLKGIATHTEEI